jgi:hypothetical protein
VATRPERRARARVALASCLVALALGTIAAPVARAADLTPPERPPDEVRSAVEQVLDRPEYRRPRPNPVERARTWARDQLARLLSSLFRGDRGTVLAWAVLGGLLALLIVLGVRFAGSVTPDLGRTAAPASVPRRSAREWRDESDAFERAGEWRLALRARYRALVADLAARGLVDEVPGRTAGEYRAEVRETVPGVAAEFGGATELFERAWYGNRPTDAADTSQFRELESRVLAGAG